MKHKTFACLLLVFAVMAMVNLMAQTNAKGNAGLQEQQNTIAKQQQELQEPLSEFVKGSAKGIQEKTQSRQKVIVESFTGTW